MRLRLNYFISLVNWMELTLYISSIIFVSVFHDECLCPLQWQWQIGIVAVFLAWINLMIFVSKFPLTGIYVLMFTTICYTFLKILVLSLLLVIGFALTFFLVFHEPSVMVGNQTFKVVTCSMFIYVCEYSCVLYVVCVCVCVCVCECENM